MNEDDIEAVLLQVRKTVFRDNKYDLEEEHMIDVLFDQMSYIMVRAKTEQEAKKRAMIVVKNWCKDCTFSGISLLPNDY